MAGFFDSYLIPYWLHLLLHGRMQIAKDLSHKLSDDDSVLIFLLASQACQSCGFGSGPWLKRVLLGMDC